MEPVIEGLSLILLDPYNIMLIFVSVLIGVLVGTYSSIYIAAPTLLFLEERYGNAK